MTAPADDSRFANLIQVAGVPLTKNPQELANDRYVLVNEDIVRNRVPRPALIEGVLAQGSTNVLYGASGVGKSFVALDLGFTVATGIDWFGRRVVQSPVAYVVAEGDTGLAQRIEAWKVAHRMNVPADLFFLLEPIQLQRSGDVGDLIEVVRQLNPCPGLLVVDTLARSMVGIDENTAQGMGVVVDAISRIAREVPTSVLAVHHTGKKGGTDARGSSALHAAVDAMMLLQGPRHSLSLTCQKSRDYSAFPPISLALCEVGPSLVPVPAAAKQSGNGGMKEDAASALTTLADSLGGRAAAKAWEEQWIAATGRSHGSFHSAREHLLSSQFVAKEGGLRGRYSLTDSGRAVIRTIVTDRPNSVNLENQLPSKSTPPSKGVGLDDDTTDDSMVVP